MSSIQHLISRCKPFLRWVVLGGTLFFLGKVLKDHWQQVATVRVSGMGWTLLAIALLVTLVAHITAGWVWGQILVELKQPMSRFWAVQVYLLTNIAKYLPGNVWHLYGRVMAAKEAGTRLDVATLSVLLEPLLMAAAALLVALLGSQQVLASYGWLGVTFQAIGLIGVLLGVHPKVLNPLLHYLGKAKQKVTGSRPDAATFQLTAYPVVPFLGELGFLGLRGAGFLVTFGAFSPIAPGQIPLLMSAFALAWLLGFIIPGAPGGLGVFEATAIALLGSTFPAGIVLTVVAVYRLISVLAEALGAGLAWVWQRVS